VFEIRRCCLLPWVTCSQQGPAAFADLDHLRPARLLCQTVNAIAKKIMQLQKKKQTNGRGVCKVIYEID
jgi:hypothetical protein